MYPWLQNAVLDLRRISLLLRKTIQYRLFPYANRIPLSPIRDVPFAIRLRRALEDLGLTYLKLGQFLALRFDILPKDICEELGRLFETVRPLPPDITRAIIEAELGGPLECFFSDFTLNAIASASVSQVHRACTHHGHSVAVKVQRPGLEPILQSDIRNLLRLATVIEVFGLLGKLSATGMVREFANWTQRELDFTIEGGTADKLRATMPWYVVIPRIFWRLTTPRVLTMEFVEGLSASQLTALMADGGTAAVQAMMPNFDLDLSLDRMSEACLKQLFIDGIFHGDPHPGNVLFRNDNLVAFIDFGIFGELNAVEREILAGQIENLALGEIQESLRFYMRQLTATEETDFKRMEVQAIGVLRRWHASLSKPGGSVQERHLARYTGEMIEISRQNHLRYGLNFLLFWRALNSFNATLWMIAPDYDLIGRLRDFFARTRPGLAQRVIEALLSAEARRSGLSNITEVLRTLPQALANLASNGSVRSMKVVEEDNIVPRRHGTRMVSLACLLISLVIVMQASYLGGFRVLYLAAFAPGLVYAVWKRRASH